MEGSRPSGVRGEVIILAANSRDFHPAGLPNTRKIFLLHVKLTIFPSGVRWIEHGVWKTE